MKKNITVTFIIICVLIITTAHAFAQTQVVPMPQVGSSFEDAVKAEGGESNSGLPSVPETLTSIENTSGAVSTVDGQDKGISESAPSSGSASYKLLEAMPGVGNKGETATFPQYIVGMYNFGLAIVSISALLMIVIGGFYYIASAGNQAQATTAKKIITDAILGLIVVFIAVLVLETINPDLLKTSPGMEALRESATSSSK